MRLWHKCLIPSLPRKQLISQWRECCAIASRINSKGTPNHPLVNKVLDYSPRHLYTYGKLIYDEITNRGYKADWNKFYKYYDTPMVVVDYNDLFNGWHNDRYYNQCYYNLQEKADCKMILPSEWSKIEGNL